MDPNRRAHLKSLLSLVSLAGTGLACNVDEPETTAASPRPAPIMSTPTHSTRMPAVYYPHGGGPWPFMDTSRFGAGVPQAYARMRAYLASLAHLPPSPPKALLVISAHWEAGVPTVMSNAHPPMLYDYSGFPPETYDVNYPAPGAPDTAAMVLDHLRRAGIEAGDDPTRGFDHGSFVPLMISHPAAELPTFQLSLKAGLDPAEHLALGRALAPLRDQGVFIMGSGMSYHNMRGFFGQVPSIQDDARAFDEWLVEACAGEASQRESALVRWAQAPRAKACHPREEHLLPLMVVAGAAGEDPGSAPYRDVLMGAQISALHFG